MSVGGIGGDINCGVRLMRTDLSAADVERRKSPLAEALFRSVLVDIRLGDDVGIEKASLPDVLVRGGAWGAERGFEHPVDATLDPVGPAHWAGPIPRPSAKGLGRVGSTSSARLALEITFVSFKSSTRFTMRRSPTSLVSSLARFVSSSTRGSRGLGHQLFDDYLTQTQDSMARAGFTVPDRRLSGFPIESPGGQRYLAAMAAAANYAFANRQGITARARGALHQVFGRIDLRLLYDVGHNVAKFESHLVDGREAELLVHRKGATRAFPAGHRKSPQRIVTWGSRCLDPGDMDRYSFVAVGTPRAMELTFGSICHGAGRRLTRADAQRRLQGTDVAAALARDGVIVRTSDERGLAEEAPLAYTATYAVAVVGVVLRAVGRFGLPHPLRDVSIRMPMLDGNPCATSALYMRLS